MSVTRGTSLTNSQNTLLYSAESVRAIDQYVIENQGVEGFELMQRAAAAAFRQLVREWPQASPLLIFCGGGNNGGDGYLVAAAARRHGLRVRCLAVKDPAELKGDAASAYEKARADGVAIDRWNDIGERDRHALFASAGLIVDAMLGTGVEGAPREPYAGIIEACNESGAPVLAVDIPSGLNATTGVTEGAVIHASVTVTFIALKSGLFLGQGPECAGRVDFEALDLAVDATVHGQSPNAVRFDWSALRRQLPRRPVTAHKGRFGHVLVVAGDRGFGGAGLMAAEAAARAGAGLVTLATHADHVAAALTRCPSLMVRGVSHGSELAELIDAADTLVCGPGLGQHAWGQQMLQQVLKSGKRRILDADALNLLAKQAAEPFPDQVLTPHPGEAARLLQCSPKDIEADRLEAAAAIQRKFGGVALLKGAGTVVADGQSGPWVLDGGNPGMATGGMGDILSGLVGALLGQGLAPLDAARMAAGLHLAAANAACRHWGYMGLLPTDLLTVVPRLLAVAEGLVDGGEL